MFLFGQISPEVDGLWTISREIAAPGVVFVMAIVIVALWKERINDKKYIRDETKANLQITARLTALLEKEGSDRDEATKRILEEIRALYHLIMKRGIDVGEKTDAE